MKVVFDLDGTLIDSFDRHSVVLFDAFKKYGITDCDWFDEAEFRGYKRQGNATKAYLKEYSGLSDEKIAAVAEFWRSHIEDDEYLKMDRLYTDTIPCLEELYGKHDIIFLTCRNNKPGLMDEVERLKILKYATECVVVNPAEQYDTKCVYLKSLNVKDTVVVGDTEMDHDAAEKYDMKYYVLNRGFRSKEYWDGRNVASYDDLKNLIEVIENK